MSLNQLGRARTKITTHQNIIVYIYTCCLLLQFFCLNLKLTGMRTHTYNPDTRRLRQADCHEFKARLGYISSRLAWATEWEPVSKTQNHHHHKKPVTWRQMSHGTSLSLPFPDVAILNLLMLFSNTSFFFPDRVSYYPESCLALDKYFTSAGMDHRYSHHTVYGVLGT